MTAPTDDPRPALVDLSRSLGDPVADLAILGEGNTSAGLADGSFLVKASGVSLRDAAAADFVSLDRRAVLELIDDTGLSEHDTSALTSRLKQASTEPGGRVPSIETMLHALALEQDGVTFAGHTHPTAVNGLLCSDRAQELVQPLFPDQVVVCGRHALLVPYAEPGLPLGRTVRDGLRDHLDKHGKAPKLIYLGNHGIVALGASATEVLQITAMAVKAARVLQLTLSVGRPQPLSPETADLLDNRPDEIHRRRVLAGLESAPAQGASA